MSILISLLVVLLIIGLVYWAITAIPLPPPVRTVAIVILCIFGIIVLVGYIPGFHLPR